MTDVHRIRRQNRDRADAAVKYLVKTPAATYRSAAKKFGVRVHQLRARINYRYGSLSNARSNGAMIDHRWWQRPCIVCGDTTHRPYGQYRCETCKAEAEKIHDGAV